VTLKPDNEEQRTNTHHQQGSMSNTPKKASGPGESKKRKISEERSRTMREATTIKDVDDNKRQTQKKHGLSSLQETLADAGKQEKHPTQEELDPVAQAAKQIYSLLQNQMQERHLPTRAQDDSHMITNDAQMAPRATPKAHLRLGRNGSTPHFNMSCHRAYCCLTMNSIVKVQGSKDPFRTSSVMNRLPHVQNVFIDMSTNPNPALAELHVNLNDARTQQLLNEHEMKSMDLPCEKKRTYADDMRDFMSKDTLDMNGRVQDKILYIDARGTPMSPPSSLLMKSRIYYVLMALRNLRNSGLQCIFDHRTSRCRFLQE
jgi:hypothetical protein